MSLRNFCQKRVAPVLFILGLAALVGTPIFAQSEDSSDETSNQPAMCATDHEPNYVEFAEGYLEGDEDERVPERAVEVLTNGCNREDAASCERLADLYEKGVGVEADAERAAKLRERAESLRDNDEDDESGS